MIQQINLYQVKGDSNKHLLLNPYIFSFIAFILLLITISGFSLNSLYSNQVQQKQLKAQLQQVDTRLQHIQAEHPNQPIDTVLSQELQQTQNYYQNLTQTLEMLADTQSDRSQGFSRYLQALANQADHNIWLTRIQFNSKSDSIRLEGSTFKPEQISLLLERLQTSNVFKGRYFAKLDIQQSKENSEQFNFSVSSSLKTESEESNAGKH
jgi:uncharacterized short protein YbdD (DUF466 family)